MKETYNNILEENKPEYMQGWGTWTGESKTIKAKEFLVKKRLKELQEKKSQMQLKGIKNKNLKVSACVDKKFNNYLVKELPHPYTSHQQFEQINNTPLGPEWNTLTTYKQITQPKVIKFIGKVIGPMGSVNGQSTKTKKLTEIIDKASKKIVRTKTKM